MTISEIAEKWESLAETVNWGTQMLIRSCTRRRGESEHKIAEGGAHCFELKVDIGEIWERIVHVSAAPQPQPVEPVVANRCLGLWNQSIEIVALASEIDKDFDRNTSILC